MSLEQENQIYRLQEAVRSLTLRVAALETKFGKPQQPLSKRVKTYLTEEDNSLSRALERARKVDDKEAIKHITMLIDRAD